MVAILRSWARAMFRTMVALCILAALPSSARGQAATHGFISKHEVTSLEENQGPQFWWELRPLIRQGFVVGSAIRASDNLDGFQLGYGIRADGDENRLWGALWVSRLSGQGQQVVGVRGDIRPWLAAGHWAGIGPVLGLGVDYRSEDPRAGLGGYLVLGVDLALWTRWHWQVALDVERDFAISSESRNQLALSIAYAHDRLTAGPDHD